jgi:hypothetical protein
MKPLPTEPFTAEDEAIWYAAAVRRDLRWALWLNQRSLELDRRDAALMFHGQRNKPLLSRVIRTDDLSIVNLRGVSGRGSMTLTGPWPPVLPDITYFA